MVGIADASRRYDGKRVAPFRSVAEAMRDAPENSTTTHGAIFSLREANPPGQPASQGPAASRRGAPGVKKGWLLLLLLAFVVVVLVLEGLMAIGRDFSDGAPSHDPAEHARLALLHVGEASY